jgi:hypothetical protein
MAMGIISMAAGGGKTRDFVGGIQACRTETRTRQTVGQAVGLFECVPTWPLPSSPRHHGRPAGRPDALTFVC